MRNKKIIVVVCILLAVLIIAFLFLRKDTKQPTDLSQSDVIATNINFPDHLSGNKLRFFSGSTVAQIDATSPNKSSSLSPTIPMGVTAKVVWTPDGALVKLNSLAPDSFLLSKVPDSTLYKNNTSWWRLTKDGISMFSLPNIISADIYDVYFDSSEGMHVVFQDNSTRRYSVARYASIAGGKQLARTNTTYELSSIVGGNGNETYFKDPSGRIYTISGKSLIDSSFESKFDSKNNRIIYTLLHSSDTKDGRQETGIGTKITYDIMVYSLKDKRSRSLQTSASGKFFVSDGVVIIPKNENDKNTLRVDDGTKTFDYSVTAGKKPLEDITNIFTAKNDQFIVTDNEGNLTIISGDQNLLSNLPSVKLIKTNLRDISFDQGLIYYDLTNNTAEVIVYGNSVADFPSAITAAIPRVQSYIGDVNQVNIAWVFSPPPEGEAGTD